MISTNEKNRGGQSLLHGHCAVAGVSYVQHPAAVIVLESSRTTHAFYPKFRNK